MIELYFPNPEKTVEVAQLAQEYTARCKAVKDAFASCPHKVGDVGWPFNKKETQKYGQLRVIAVCSDYKHYGNVQWNDPPYILVVQPLKDTKITFNCTANYMVKDEPTT